MTITINTPKAPPLGSVTRDRLAAEVAAELYAQATRVTDRMRPLDPTVTYARTDMAVTITGLHNGRLYGTLAANGHWATSDDAGATWTDRTYSPSVHPGGVDELVFSDTHMFSYTTAGKFARNPIGTFNNWTVVTIPVPAGTTSRPSMLTWNGTNLFFGTYNGATTAGGAHVFRSTNLGDTWTSIFNPLGAKHIHAVHTDGVALWVTVGDRGGVFTDYGLYYCADANATTPVFEHLSSNRYGIDFVITPQIVGIPQRIIMEGDGLNEPHLMAYPYDQKTDADVPTTAAVWFDAAPVDGLGSWRGTVRGIRYTANGDIFFLTTAEGGAVGTRYGAWLSPGPYFNRAVLLEDLGTTAPWPYLKTFETGGYLFNGRYRMVTPKFLAV